MKLALLSTLLTASLVSSATLDKRYVVNPPGATQGSAASNCNRWDYVGTGVTCSTIASKYGLSASQIIAWNPFLNSGCTNMWAGYWVCSGVSSTSVTSAVPPASSVVSRRGVPIETITASPVTCSCPSLTYTTTATVTVTAGLN